MSIKTTIVAGVALNALVFAGSATIAKVVKPQPDKIPAPQTAPQPSQSRP